MVKVVRHWWKGLRCCAIAVTLLHSNRKLPTEHVLRAELTLSADGMA